MAKVIIAHLTSRGDLTPRLDATPEMLAVINMVRESARQFAIKTGSFAERIALNEDKAALLYAGALKVRFTDEFGQPWTPPKELQVATKLALDAQAAYAGIPRFIGGYEAIPKTDLYLGNCDHAPAELQVVGFGPDPKHHSLKQCRFCGSRAWFNDIAEVSTTWMTRA